MGDCNDTVGGDEGSLHDIHVLPSNGIIEAEEVMVLAWDLHGIHLIHGASPLVCDVMDDKHAACISQLVVLPVVHLLKATMEPSEPAMPSCRECEAKSFDSCARRSMFVPFSAVVRLTADLDAMDKTGLRKPE